MSGRSASLWLRAGELTLALLALLVPLAFLLRGYDAASLKLTLLQAGALVLAACWLLKGLERGRWEAPASALPVLVPAGLLALWVLVRLAGTPSPAAALPAALRPLLGLTLFAAAVLECGGARPARRFSGWLLASAWLAAPYALLQRAGIDPLPWKGAFGQAAFATLGAPEAFGLFAAACAPLALARIADAERDHWGRRADAALLVLLGAAVAATGSLAAAAAFVCAAVASAAALPAFLPSNAGRRAAAGALLLAAAVGAASLLAPRPGLSEASSGRSLWLSSLAVVGAHPWGVGPGRFAVVLDELRPQGLPGDARPEHAPALLVEVAAELGLPGTILWTMVFGSVLARAWRARRRFIERAALAEAAQLAGLSAALAAVLVSSQWIGAAHEAAAGWLLWPLAGLAGGLALLAWPSPVTVLPLSLTEAARRRVGHAALLGLALLLTLPARWQLADVHLGMAAAAARSGAYAEAARLAQRADVLGAPRRLESRYLAGAALLASGRPAEALGPLEDLEAEAPAFARLQHLKGRSLLALKRWEPAEAAFERQRSLDPAFVPALEGLATAAKAAGHYDAAARALLSAIALEPSDPVHYMALADVYARQNRKAEARQLEQRVRKLRRSSSKSGRG